MSQTSGFFNAFHVDGMYDRTYNANHYSENLAVIISDGVLRSANDDLKPTANGLSVNIGVGRAWIEGHWYKNDNIYNIVVPTPPTANPRIDRVVLRLDKTDALNGRKIELDYITGTAAASPVAPAPMDDDNYKDIVLCDVYVGVNATSVTVTDKRADKSVCGWVYSTAGDNSFFTSLDGQFNEWFGEKKETLASVTLFKQYVWRGVTTFSGQTVVTFDIPQYDPTGVDILQVYLNGILELEGEDYTLSGRNITFTMPKEAQQEITVICYKSIDGTGLGNIADKLTELENKVAALDDFTNYNYICTGVDDNIRLSEIVSAFANGENDIGMMTINIYGTFGCTTPVGGSGTLEDRYQWIKCGGDEYTWRKVVLDFSNCSAINIACPNNSHNQLFYGYNCHVKNCRITATETGSGGSILALTGSGGRAVFERCIFSISAVANSYIAQRGEFNECRFTVQCAIGNAFVFSSISNTFIKVNGGEFYAYAPTGSISAVFYVPTGGTSTVMIANGASCPTSAVTGYVQSYCVYDLSGNGKCAYNNIVSALNLSAASQIVRDRINQSKPDFV